jgi:hypothetical protein
MEVPVAMEPHQAAMGQMARMTLVLGALAESIMANSLVVARKGVLSQSLVVLRQMEAAVMETPATQEEMQRMRPANPLQNGNRVRLRVSQKLVNQLSRHRLLLTPLHQATP